MPPHIYRVQIRNYKSLADVNVGLGSPTLLVGPNGSGKSNFIDALAFVQQCLDDSIELAFKSRGGIDAVRRRSGGHPTNIGVRLTLALSEDVHADYAFEIAAKPEKRFRIAHERCVVHHFMGPEHAFEVRNGKFVKPIAGIRPRVAPDRLVLYAASATEEFRPVYDFLTAMRFYSIAPSEVGKLQDADPGDVLSSDGSNAAAVLKRLADHSRNGSHERLCRLLGKVVPGIEGVEHHAIGQKETIRFRQDIGLKHPWRFDALSMSDGTLRVLGLLLAVYQTGDISVVGVEEPEATVHPGVADLIIQVLLDAAHDRQVLVTTHSPDLLDSNLVDDRQIRAVTMEDGRTVIAPLDTPSRSAIREHLYTAGELLRAGELAPDREVAKDNARNLSLFGPIERIIESPTDAGARTDR